MRLAVLQLQLNHASPSERLQQILMRVDRAAASNPAPDLIILPGACDAGGAWAPDAARGHQGFRVGLSTLAKDWGVYIAAGLHEGGLSGVRHETVIFDPDGDVAAVSGLQRPRAGEDATRDAYSHYSADIGVFVAMDVRVQAPPLDAARGMPIVGCLCHSESDWAGAPPETRWVPPSWENPSGAYLVCMAPATPGASAAPGHRAANADRGSRIFRADGSECWAVGHMREHLALVSLADLENRVG